jgi:hypothetical protein
MIVGITSAKGSFGITTTALALALVAGEAPDDASLFVEADPSGGDLECWAGPYGDSGLIRLTTEARLARHHAAQACSTPLRGANEDIAALVAPTAGLVAKATLAALDGDLTEVLGALDVPTLVDLGRWTTDHPAPSLIAAANLLLVLVRPTLSGVEHAREVIDQVRQVNPCVAVALFGTEPYGSREVAHELGTPAVGSVPWDPRAASCLLDLSHTRAWGRSALAHAARGLLGGIAAAADRVFLDD